MAERSSALDSSSDFSDQQSVGSSPGVDICPSNGLKVSCVIHVKEPQLHLIKKRRGLPLVSSSDC